VRDLGADEVIDHRTENVFERSTARETRCREFGAAQDPAEQSHRPSINREQDDGTDNDIGE
jgi:hypothetical protein